MTRPRKRYLSGNKGSEGPTNFLFFDTESWQPKETKKDTEEELYLRLWVACTARREGNEWTRVHYHRGHTPNEFYKLVEKQCDWKRPLWCFAHNLGHDLTQLQFWDALEKKRFTPGPIQRPPSPTTGKERAPWRGRMVLEGRPTFLVLRNPYGLTKWIDTGNYWPHKLAAIGETYQLEKLDMPAWDANEEEWFVYCQRDVDVCRVAVCSLMDFWLREDCGVFRMTAPSLALQNFQHTCDCRSANGDKVNLVLEDDSPSRPIERASYYGGRVEPLFIGKMKGPIHHLDCNMLYPSVMVGNLFPRRRTKSMRQCSPKELLNAMACWGAIADVSIDSGFSERSYPYKPDGIQLHAAGRYWTTLAGPELHRALVAGDVKAVGEAWLYSLAPLFDGWARQWINRRLQTRRDNKPAEEEFCKLILNSLSGKFAQRGDWWTDTIALLPMQGWGYRCIINDLDHTVDEYRFVGGHVQVFSTGNEPAHAFPALSAYVTSYAREYMRRIITALPEETVLYTATDSLVVTQQGYEVLDALELVKSDEIGAFKHLGTYDDCEIVGPNWYRLGDRWTVSGLAGKAYIGPTGKRLVKIWDSLPTIISQRPTGCNRIRTIELMDSVPTVKNAPGRNGWRKPFQIGPDSEWSDRPPRFRSPIDATH